MHRSKISWTDYSGGFANFVQRGKKPGDCECSPGCRECYVKRYWRINPDAWPDDTTWSVQKLEQLSRCRPRPNGSPYRRGPGSKPMVFVCDTGDLFHPNVPAHFIFSALDVMRDRSDIDWQILTKRHERAHKLIVDWIIERRMKRLPRWIWIMFTVEDQERLRLRMPYLVNIPSTVRGLSLEPLLGPVDILNSGMWDWRYTYEHWKSLVPGAGPPINWFVVGGESGIGARPMKSDWVRGLRDQAKTANVAFHLKQWGDYQPQTEAEREEYIAAGWNPDARRGGCTLDGETWLREFPKEAMSG
jgi:protein gp37